MQKHSTQAPTERPLEPSFSTGWKVFVVITFLLAISTTGQSVLRSKAHRAQQTADFARQDVRRLKSTVSKLEARIKVLEQR